MSKICVRAWYVPEDLNYTPYQHDQIIEGADLAKVLAVAGEIFETGLHVMLYHHRDGTGDVVIWADTQRFTQR